MDTFWSSLPMTRATKRSVKKRTLLLAQHDIPEHGYIVTKGAVKMYQLSRDGEEQIIGFRTPGDFFPEAWLLDKKETADCYYETLEQSSLLTITRETMKQFVKRSAAASHDLLTYFVNRELTDRQHIMALGQSRASDKILCILRYLLDYYSVPVHEHDAVIRFPLTHATLGNLTGLTRETINTELTRLRDQHIITYSIGEFIIHIPPFLAYYKTEIAA